MMMAAIALGVGDAQGCWEPAEPLLGEVGWEQCYQNTDLKKYSFLINIVIAENCIAYGIRGKSNILEAKKLNFFTKKEANEDAYYVNTFSCDPDIRMVSFQYECFLKGMEGRGTEMVYFQENGLISKVIGIRHQENQPKLSCPLCSN